MSNPLISIVIAVFNGEETLQRCLDSIKEQSYSNKELLIIDGNSTDRSVPIIKQHADMIQFWLSEPDRGIYDAWNKALTHVRGDWILFLGCDDYFSYPEALADLVQCTQQSPNLQFVSGQAAMLDEDGTVKKVKGRPWAWSHFRWAMGLVVHPGALHKKELFDTFGNFNTAYAIAGDYEFLMRPGPKLQTAFLPKIVVSRASDGVSNRFVFKSFNEIYQVHRNSKHISQLGAILGLVRNIGRYYLGKLKRLALRGAAYEQPRQGQNPL